MVGCTPGEEQQLPQVQGPIVNCGLRLLAFLEAMGGDVEPEVKRAFQRAVVSVRTTEPPEAFYSEHWETKRRETSQEDPEEIGPFLYDMDSSLCVCRGSGEISWGDDVCGPCFECSTHPWATAWKDVDTAVAMAQEQFGLE
jgi:hypothetical protein